MTGTGINECEYNVWWQIECLNCLFVAPFCLGGLFLGMLRVVFEKNLLFITYQLETLMVTEWSNTALQQVALQ